MSEPSPNQPPVLTYTNLQHPVLPVPAMRCGRYLITNFQAALPPLCPLCGRPGNGKKNTLQIDAATSLSFPWNSNRTVKLDVTFCSRHYQLHKRLKPVVAFAVITTPSILALMLVSGIRLTGTPFRAGLFIPFFVLLLAGIAAVTAARAPRCRRNAGNYAYLSGVHPNLLAQLPSFPASPSGTLSPK